MSQRLAMCERACWARRAEGEAAVHVLEGHDAAAQAAAMDFDGVYTPTHSPGVLRSACAALRLHAAVVCRAVPDGRELFTAFEQAVQGVDAGTVQTAQLASAGQKDVQPLETPRKRCVRSQSMLSQKFDTRVRAQRNASSAQIR